MGALDLYKRVLDVIHSRSPILLSGRYLIIGAGGVGTWITLMLTLTSDPAKTSITVIDDDVLEPVNANRLPYPLPWFFDNLPKVEALRLLVQQLRPGIEYKPLPIRIDHSNINELLQIAIDCDVIIDAVDNEKAIQLVWELGRKSRKPVLSAHYDGRHGSLMWLPFHVDGFEPPPLWGEGPGQGYTAPSWAPTPAALAAAAVEVIADKPDKLIHIDF